MERRTKVIATMGPACESQELVHRMVIAGLDVARLNFSHADYPTHRRFVEWIRSSAERFGAPVAVLQDIQGPKIRVGTFPGGAVTIESGDSVRLRPGSGEAQPGEIYVDYDHLLDDVGLHDGVLLADGLIRLEVASVLDGGLMAHVVEGGVLSDHKGVSFPHSQLQAPSLTDKDRRDLEYGAEIGVDIVAASFVRSGDDVRQVAKLAGSGVPVIAKVELASAYENLDDILSVADGIMVARGDLGVELPLEHLPLIQKDMITRTNEAGRISITATEMLESMTQSPRPTRAEVTDVANAVLDGTDAVMLSAETATGRFPVRTVEVMDSICRSVEASPLYWEARGVEYITEEMPFPSAAAQAAVGAAHTLGIDTLVAFTESGSTARLISKYRPSARIVAFTPVPETYRRMAMYWGVRPQMFDRMNSTDEMIHDAEEFLLAEQLAAPGDGVILVAGVPPNQRASTNLVKLHIVGEASSGVPGTR